MKSLSILVGLTLLTVGPVTPLWSQEAENENAADEAAVVHLAPAELVETKNTIDYISRADMDRKNATSLADVMKGSLGISPSYVGARGDNYFRLRGFDQHQIGLYVDGVPVATTWRNEYDYSRFATWDLESVEVSKGFSSTLLGAGNLGGVINMRTAKPTKEFEFKAQYFNYFDRKFDDQAQAYGVSLGTKQEKFYLKANYFQEQRQFFTTSADFIPTANQGDGRRNNSDKRDRKISFLAGYTPSEDVDIYLGYSNQEAKKGTPAYIYSGSQPDGGVLTAVNTRWPAWNSERVYLNADINLNESAYLKTSFFYDKHEDDTVMFNKDSGNGWDSIHNNTGPGSRYDDQAYGGRLEGGYSFNDRHKLALAAGYKVDTHKEYVTAKNPLATPAHRPGAQANDVKDSIWDFGAEYTFKPIDPLSLVFGAAYTDIETKHVKVGLNTNNPTKGTTPSYDAFNWQVGAFYEFAPSHELFATVAHKTRLPTMRERYNNRSYNGNDPSGTPVGPEKAMHYELGYRGHLTEKIKLQSSLFYSEVEDMIDLPRNSYARNLDDTYEFYGAELGLEAVLNEYFSGGFNLSYLKWNNATGQDKLTKLPNFSGSAYAALSPRDDLSFIARIDGSSRWWQNRGGDRQVRGHTEVGLKAVYDVNDNLSFEFGAENLFDRNYEYDLGYPSEGRTFFLGGTYTY